MMGKIAEGFLNIHHSPLKVVKFGEACVPSVSFSPGVSYDIPKLNIRNRATHFIRTLSCFGLILNELFSFILRLMGKRCTS